MAGKSIKSLHIVSEGKSPFIELSNHYLNFFPHSEFDSTVLYLIGYSDQITESQTNAKNIMYWELNDSRLKLSLENLKRFYGLMKEEQYDLVVCHTHHALIMACLINFIMPRYKMIGFSYKQGEFKSKLTNALIYLRRKKLRLFGVLKSIQLDMEKDLKGIPSEYINTAHFSLNFKKIRHERLTRIEAKKILKIHEGRFVFAVKHESGINDDIFTVLTAFSYSREKIKHGILVVFCEREEEIAIRKKSKRLLLEDLVIYHYDLNGFSQFTKAFDGVLINSRQDMMSVSLLESMVTGVPVIAVKEMANEEYLGKYGCFYNANDAHQLTYFMDMLFKLTADERMALKKKVLDQINENFSPAVCRKKFQALSEIQDFLYHEE